MQNQVSWHYVRSATGKSKSHFHAYQGTLRAAQSVRSSSCCSSLFSWFLHVQPDNKLKCRSVLSTWAPSHLPLLLWGALRRGRGWCSMGQCVNKMHSVVRGCKQVFLSFFGSSLFLLLLPLLLLDAVTAVADALFEMLLTNHLKVCVRCVLCVVCPLTYFIRKASDKFSPPLPAALHTLHSCRNYAASKWVRKN